MSNRDPFLNHTELMIPAVTKILKYFDEKLAKLRVQNDKFDADVHIRGRIAEIKEFQRVITPKEHTEAAPRRIPFDN